MARGKSGRVVLEIDPDLKRQLYATLENKQKTMKEWFIKEAEGLIYGDKQPSLFDNSNNQSDIDNKNGIVE
ncbi:MAG: hypothetical protein JXA04_08455 [Gammaproteobacteria bacterium]|nr:hypothetical protein [Gammaproteobacteria bacterium]